MIVRGPFNIKWGDNTIEDVENISIDYSNDSEDYETIKGRVFELDKSEKITATLTLLSTDIAALAILLPQYFVANGATLSSGETVENANGAIDVVPHDCDEAMFAHPLDIISCGNPGQITRILNARTKIEAIEVDNRIQKVVIKLVGEPLANQALVQMIAEEYISPPEFIIWDNGEVAQWDQGGQWVVDAP